MTWALVTVPYSPNNWLRSCSVVVKGRFPTYKFLLDMTFPPGAVTFIDLAGNSLGPAAPSRPGRSLEQTTTRFRTHSRSALGCIADLCDQDRRETYRERA